MDCCEHGYIAAGVTYVRGKMGWMGLNGWARVGSRGDRCGMISVVFLLTSSPGWSLEEGRSCIYLVGSSNAALPPLRVHVMYVYVCVCMCMYMQVYNARRSKWKLPRLEVGGLVLHACACMYVSPCLPLSTVSVWRVP